MSILKVVLAVVATCILVVPVLFLRGLMGLGVPPHLAGKLAERLRTIAQRLWTWAHI